MIKTTHGDECRHCGYAKGFLIKNYDRDNTQRFYSHTEVTPRLLIDHEAEIVVES